MENLQSKHIENYKFPSTILEHLQKENQISAALSDNLISIIDIINGSQEEKNLFCFHRIVYQFLYGMNIEKGNSGLQ